MLSSDFRTNGITSLGLGPLTVEVVRSETIQAIMAAIAQTLPDLITLDYASLALVSPKQNQFRVETLKGPASPSFEGELSLDGSVVEMAIHLHEPQAIRLDVAFPFQDLHPLAQTGLKILLTVPLHTRDRYFGSLMLARSQITPFLPQEIEVMEQVALLVSSNIERLELLKKAQKAVTQNRSYTTQLEILNRICQKLSSSVTEQEAFNVIANMIEQIIDCDGIIYAIPVKSRQAFKILAIAGNDSLPSGSYIPFANSGLGVALNSGKISPQKTFQSPYVDHKALAAAGLQSCCVVPLYAQAELIGLLNIGSRQREGLSSDKLLILTALARFMGTTLERIRVQDKTAKILAEQARTDPLTQLLNRTALETYLQSLTQMSGDQAKPFALLFIDLDRFKDVNNTLGHEMGDRLLCQVANRFKAHLRDDDVIARLGSDEFVVAVQSEPLTSVHQVSERLASTLEPPIRVLDRCIQMSCSIGISFFPQDGKTVEELMEKADLAMHNAKKQGRGLVRFYNAHLSEEISYRLQLENALQNDTLLDELEVNFQPQWDCISNKLYGFEALIRWHHPLLGWIAPMQFIPIAEELGCINKITHFVLDQALQITRHIIDTHDLILRPSVNVSAQEFQFMAQLYAETDRLLQQFQLPGDLLTIELTETVFLQQSDSIITNMNQFRDRGIRISIDDFGTGFSCLNYLLNLPLNTLKIDRAFISEINVDPKRQGVVKAILSMASSLGMGCIAEGVETHSELAFLQEYGCALIQGYRFAKPMPRNEFISFIHSFE